MTLFFFFFFQAEDGIRDLTVTGVQTCALPIFWNASTGSLLVQFVAQSNMLNVAWAPDGRYIAASQDDGNVSIWDFSRLRSEERRVGKECRSRWSPYH